MKKKIHKERQCRSFGFEQIFLQKINEKKQQHKERQCRSKIFHQNFPQNLMYPRRELIYPATIFGTTLSFQN